MNIKKFVLLTGTPKQIAWANDIRKRFFENLSTTNEKVDKAITAIVNTRTEAKWWIEEVYPNCIDAIEILKKCIGIKPGHETDKELAEYLASKVQ